MSDTTDTTGIVLDHTHALAFTTGSAFTVAVVYFATTVIP